MRSISALVFLAIALISTCNGKRTKTAQDHTVEYSRLMNLGNVTENRGAEDLETTGLGSLLKTAIDAQKEYILRTDHHIKDFLEKDFVLSVDITCEKKGYRKYDFFLNLQRVFPRPNWKVHFTAKGMNSRTKANKPSVVWKKPLHHTTGYGISRTGYDTLTEADIDAGAVEFNLMFSPDNSMQEPAWIQSALGLDTWANELGDDLVRSYRWKRSVGSSGGLTHLLMPGGKTYVKFRRFSFKGYLIKSDPPIIKGAYFEVETNTGNKKSLPYSFTDAQPHIIKYPLLPYDPSDGPT